MPLEPLNLQNQPIKPIKHVPYITKDGKIMSLDAPQLIKQKQPMNETLGSLAAKSDRRPDILALYHDYERFCTIFLVPSQHDFYDLFEMSHGYVINYSQDIPIIVDNFICLVSEVSYDHRSGSESDTKNSVEYQSILNCMVKVKDQEPTTLFNIDDLPKPIKIVQFGFAP